MDGRIFGFIPEVTTQEIKTEEIKQETKTEKIKKENKKHTNND